MATCGVKIKWGMSADTVTECDQDPSHVAAFTNHSGPGLSEFPYQRIEWQPGDRREFVGDWRPCVVTVGCILHDGHHGRCAI
jgi:hypothetical protein